MSTLHTVNKSPFTHATLASCLEVCSIYDGILLLEDGVFGALASAPCADKISTLFNLNLTLYALIDDVNARGLQEKIRNNVQLINYTDFVQLSIQHKCVQSWY
jgi:tRNA 2-thiouridine synthesizing protein B